MPGGVGKVSVITLKNFSQSLIIIYYKLQVGEKTVFTPEECVEECENYFFCSFATYFPPTSAEDAGACELFSDCELIRLDDCGGCKVYEPGCKLESSPGEDLRTCIINWYYFAKRLWKTSLQKNMASIF